MANPTSIAPLTVSVAPTTTTLQVFDVSKTAVLSIQIVNLDASQTFNGSIRTRSRADVSTAVLPFVDTLRVDFQGIGPGMPARADVQVGGAAELDVVGTMSGAGGNVSIATRDLPR